MCFKMNILIYAASFGECALWDIFRRAGEYTLMEIAFKVDAFSIKNIVAKIWQPVRVLP